MKYYDLHKDKLPKWAYIEICGIRENTPQFRYALMFRFSTKIKDGATVREEPQWLMDNLSTKSGFTTKQYRYIFLRASDRKYPLKVGVAFLHLEHATAFKIRFCRVK